MSYRTPSQQSVLDGRWPEATVLDASALDDDALDASLARLAAEGTRSLALSGVRRRSLRGLGAMRSLRQLHVFDPELDRLPAELGLLSGLRELRLETFGLLSLPRAMGSLRGLIALHIDSHSLSHLPAELGLLSELRSFGLVIRDHYERHDWDWELTYLAKAAFRQPIPELFRALSALPRLQTLLLGEPPAVLWHARCPAKLLEELPAELALLEALETLILVECPRVSLPDEVQAMPKLGRICAREARIEGRPWLRARGAEGGYEVYEVIPE